MSDETNIAVEVSESLCQQDAAPDADVTDQGQDEPTGGEEETRDEQDHGEDAGDAPEQQGEDEGEGDDVPYGVKKKLGKLTARVKERDEKLAAQEVRLKELNDRLELLQRQAKPAEPEVKDEPKPTLESCDFDLQVFEQKLDEWKDAQIKIGIRKADTERAAAQRQQAYDSKVGEFAKDKPDWIETVKRISVSQAMIDVIQDLDHGPAVTYYLGQHLGEAHDIAGMSPTKAALALARIESKLTTQTPAQTKAITGAPPPIKPLSTTAPVKKSLADLPMSEYVKERNKARKKQGGFL